jgi:hypothetical protein
MIFRKLGEHLSFCVLPEVKLRENTVYVKYLNLLPEMPDIFFPVILHPRWSKLCSTKILVHSILKSHKLSIIIILKYSSAFLLVVFNAHRMCEHARHLLSLSITFRAFLYLYFENG